MILEKEKKREGIENFLLFDHYRFGGTNTDSKADFRCEIVKVSGNDFYLKTINEKVCHWEMRIHSLTIDCDDHAEDIIGTIKFKMTAYSKQPSIFDFSQHIKKECLATIKAFDACEKYVWDMPIIEWDDIQPEHVYSFIKSIHRSYEKTSDFISVYDFYRRRIYSNWKWIDYMIRGGHGCFVGEIHPTGEHFLAFLDIGKHADFYE